VTAKMAAANFREGKCVMVTRRLGRRMRARNDNTMGAPAQVDLGRIERATPHLEDSNGKSGLTFYSILWSFLLASTAVIRVWSKVSSQQDLL
jgi:hypothetical protein